MHLVIHPNDNTRTLYPTLGANIHDKNHSKTFREKEKEREREERGDGCWKIEVYWYRYNKY